MKASHQGTTAMVAQATGLSVATCSNIMNELLEAGQLLDMGTEKSSGGRPAKLFQFNKDYCFTATIIIQAGEHIHPLSYYVSNLTGEIMEEGKLESKRMDQQEILQLVDQLVEKYADIKAIGIGVPGAIYNGVINICDIPELVNAPLERAIRDKHHDIEVIIENDMNSTVYGFYSKQAYDEEKTVAVATFIRGSFPGAGIMVNGRIHRGSTRFAGEITFLPYDMTSEEQFMALHDRHRFHALAGRAVTSLIAILNPETIALTGSLIEPNDVELIRQNCLHYIPQMHMPQLVLLEQPDEDYLHGLMTMTLESLSNSYQLVEKQR